MENIYTLDGKVPFLKSISFGLQHVLAMFVGNRTPLLIMSGACGIASGEFADLQLHLLQNAMLIAGVVTLVQLFSIGPIGGNAAKDFGSMENLLLAIFVLAMILFFKHGTKGFTSSSSILLGIICGYVAAFIMGFVLPTTGVTADGVEYTKAWVLNWDKVVNRFAIATGAVFLILCGLCPKLGALVSIMPQSVLGGAAGMMFSSIVISGIQLITKEPLTGRNLSIVAVALGVGYGMGANTGILAHAPQAVQLIFGGSGIVPAAMVATLLNILLPKEKE